MAYRRRMGRRESSRAFRKGQGTKKINVRPRVMRGGIRL